MAAKNSIKTVSKEALINGIYRAEFADKRVIEFDIAAVFPGFAGMNEVQKQFIRYGVKQKLDDSIADADGDIDVAVEDMQSTIDAIMSGKWTIRVAGEGGESGGLFAKALAQWKNISLGDAKALVTNMIEANLAKLNAGKPEDQHVTEKAVASALRNSLKASQPGFASAYAELQSKRKTTKKVELGIDLGGLTA